MISAEKYASSYPHVSGDVPHAAVAMTRRFSATFGAMPEMKRRAKVFLRKYPEITEAAKKAKRDIVLFPNRKALAVGTGIAGALAIGAGVALYEYKRHKKKSAKRYTPPAKR